MIFLHSCFHHGHNDETCPRFPHDPNDRVTMDGISYEAENKSFKNRMIKLKKKFFPTIKKWRVVWLCEFENLLKSSEAKSFVDNVLPNLRHFSRLVPRDAIFAGLRQTYCRKWIKTENVNSSLHFLDLNSAHSYCCYNYDFPYGKCNIMIDKKLDEFDFIDGSLVLKSSNKELYGLIKAKILPSPDHEPFLPTNREGGR